MEPKLSVKNLSYSYYGLSGETKALDNISFDIQKGEFFVIVGPSGCGKSTLLSCLSGLFSPTNGSVLIDGNEFSSSHSKVGYMHQHDLLFNWRNNYRNIKLSLEINHKNEEINSKNNSDKRIGVKTFTPLQAFKTSHRNKSFKIKRQRGSNQINELLNKYALADFSEKYPYELSGGMKQRIALIRTLVQKPDLLLLDEPFSALDFQTRLEVSADIYRIIRQEGKTAVLITHDIEEAVSMGDRILVLSKRPAKVKDIVEVNLGVTERNPFTSRDAPEFSTYFHKIYEELKNAE
jgi:NitT/TauT family transport system ATP-binding protein